MTKSNTASGPGNPRKEQQDAVAQEEGLEELQPESDTEDPEIAARHAERNAHTGAGKDARKDSEK
ncbi:MAG: hypothetical protein JWQ11_1422 [Rhizobacter sp.]|nr:hypothetical protein [Rhizobacter sp.]